MAKASVRCLAAPASGGATVEKPGMNFANSSDLSPHRSNFSPSFSTVAPPLAGAAKQRTLAFAIYDGFGALIWAGSAVAFGRAFHRAIDRVLLALENLGGWAVIVVLLIIGLWIFAKWWQRL